VVFSVLRYVVGSVAMFSSIRRCGVVEKAEVGKYTRQREPRGEENDQCVAKVMRYAQGNPAFAQRAPFYAEGPPPPPRVVAQRQAAAQFDG